MKVGDKIYHRDRPENVGTVLEAIIRKKKNSYGEYTSASYKVIFEDGIKTIHGNQVGTTYKLVEDSEYHQMSIFEYLEKEKTNEQNSEFQN